MYNILFVDDDQLILDGIVQMLDWESLSLNPPYTANSFQQATEIINSSDIHIVVSDIEMRGEDGFALLSWVKENDPRVICSFLTCHARFDYAQRAIKAGIYDYILKPVSSTELQAFVETSIKKLGATKKAAPKYSSSVKAAIQYINDNLGNMISRESICRALFISDRHLSRLFHDETGMSLLDYITQCRIDKAKELLSETELSITDICTQVGFNYPAYFTKIFKTKTGMTPLNYRKQQSEGG